jgi:hypothetical protein
MPLGLVTISGTVSFALSIITAMHGPVSDREITTLVRRFAQLRHDTAPKPEMTVHSRPTKPPSPVLLNHPGCASADRNFKRPK